MKFEFKTENENYSKLFGNFFITIISFSLIIMFCDVVWKIGIISRNFQIVHYCRLLSVEKSKSNFNKLSSLSNLKSRQKIWEFCKAAIK